MPRVLTALLHSDSMPDCHLDIKLDLTLEVTLTDGVEAFISTLVPKRLAVIAIEGAKAGLLRSAHRKETVARRRCLSSAKASV